MNNLGDKTRDLCNIVSKEILNKRCNKPQRIKEIENLLEKIKLVKAENKYQRIPGFHVINNYQPNLEDLLDGLKRMQQLEKS